MLPRTIVPLVTPLSDDGELAFEHVEPLVEFLLEQGAEALMPTALTGEGPLLTEEETLQVWESVFRGAAGRKPIFPAILSFTTAGAIRLARRAEELGAAAVMVAPLVPELYAGRSERDVIRFHEDVAGETALPIILFNYPSLTGVDLTPALVEKLAAIENVSAIKESTGDSRRISALRRRLGSRLEVICGAPTAALESLALGCTSWITGILNVVPRSGGHLFRAFSDIENLDLARRVYFEQILPIVDLLERTSNPTGTIKAGLRIRGVEVGFPRRPGQDLLEPELRELESILERILAREAAFESEFG
jgi:4-hydroxy-tetrahydrodipicolinate synthase